MADNPFLSESKEEQPQTNPFLAPATSQPSSFSGAAPTIEKTENPFLTKQPSRIAQFGKAALETPYALAETATAVVTGIAGYVGGGVSGVGSLAADGVSMLIGGNQEFSGDRAKYVQDKVQEAISYQPRTATANTFLGAMAYPFEQWHKLARVAGEQTLETLSDRDSRLSKFRVEGLPSLSPVAAATAVETAVDFLPWLFGPKAVKTGYALAEKVPYVGAAVKAVGKPFIETAEVIKAAVSPISTGIPEARVAAKTYANSVRGSDFLRNHVIEKISDKFTPKQSRLMARALIEEELALKTGAVTTKGINSLPMEMKNVVIGLLERHKPIADKAVEMGILPHASDVYFPRKVARYLGDAASERIYGKSGVQTSTTHALKRRHLTVEETSAAATEKLGVESRVIEDIRVLPMVTAELERAIAGKSLVNEVKSVGARLNLETVSDVKHPGYFTLDDPAFTKWVPRLERTAENKWQAIKTQDGKLVFDRKPIYIHESFRGPLEAILSGKPGKVASGFMQLKAKSMSLIMFSPIMHGMVIWGKALPFQILRGITLKNYFDGHKLLNKDDWVRRNTRFENSEKFIRNATDAGVSPIGNMAWMQRMSDVLQAPQLAPGRSTTAHIVGGIARVFGKKAKANTMKAVDSLGHIWHDKLLWEQIRNAQFGMYNNLSQSFVKKGMNVEAADALAAHLANRFAGAVPFEDMSAAVRNVGNIMLFSRSFNATNIGIYKDALVGLPRAVQDLIIKKGAAVDIEVANNALKQAARATLVKDIAGFYVMNALAESTWKYMQNGDAGEIAKDYVDGADRYLEAIGDNPLAAVYGLEELLPGALHEPGKEQRIYVGEREDKTVTYARNPVGKIGEDLLKAVTHPIQMVFDKLSPTAKFVGGVMFNDKSLNRGYGLEVYPGGWDNAPENLGSIAMWFMESHMPSDYAEAVVDWATGNDPEGAAKAESLAAWIGVSFSKGAPGGPVRGLVLDVVRKHESEVKRYSGKIRKLLTNGDHEEAVEVMINDANMTPAEIKSMVTRVLAPHLSEQMLRQFAQIADEKELERLQRMLEEYN